KSPFILNHPDNLRMIPAYYRDGLKPLEAPCWAGWKELYINADGTAIMCDGKLDFLNGHFGSVHKNTLRELWETEALQQRRAVVKSCTQPCIQNCYLRRESDSLAALGKDAVQLATTPLRRSLARSLTRQERPESLVLEATDIPLDIQHPHFRRLLRHAEGETLLANPADYPRRRDQGRLDSSRGFLGLEVAERLFAQLDEEQLCFPTLSLRWRGEPLLHPALGDLWALLEEGRKRGSIKRLLLPGDPAFAAAWPGLPLSPLQAPTGPVVVVSWDATLTRRWEDQRLVEARGPLLHRPLRELLAE
ncbi:MAG TPA: SPASM domain-containing protein, partial [Myxococcota bacterium]|nr:SPASM domain-containing protein [Myxococcota bacterium]